MNVLKLTPWSDYFFLGHLLWMVRILHWEKIIQQIHKTLEKDEIFPQKTDPFWGNYIIVSGIFVEEFTIFIIL